MTGQRYPAIGRMIGLVKKEFAQEEKIAVLFENCISDTLDKTLRPCADGSVFVITGDIPAMWLRDSACQLRPFLLFAKEEPELERLIAGVIKKQVQCILIDPYANAFNETANGNCWRHDRTQMRDELWERKYEVDSLCYPVWLSYLLWKRTGSAAHFTPDWLSAAKRIVEVFVTEQDHENASPYRFERENTIFLDTLSRDGKGALVKSGIGLTWSGFRPSDDACTYGYLIPSNMFASVILSQMAQIAKRVYGDAAFAGRASALAGQLREAVERCGIVPGEEKQFYAYETDGFGQYLIMDDANLPSLLSMPYFGFCDAGDERYRNTREVILSERNPYYFVGKEACGIGSPHTRARYVWPIALAMQGLTSTSRREKRSMLTMLSRIDAGTGLMHESIDADNPAHYTRPWFSWANSMFCELVMDYMGYPVMGGMDDETDFNC